MSMENEQYHSASHYKYLTQYHIVWCPKFRYSVLQNGVDITLKQILSDICNKYGYIIKALDINHLRRMTMLPCRNTEDNR